MAASETVLGSTAQAPLHLSYIYAENTVSQFLGESASSRVINCLNDINNIRDILRFNRRCKVRYSNPKTH